MELGATAAGERIQRAITALARMTVQLEAGLDVGIELLDRIETDLRQDISSVEASAEESKGALRQVLQHLGVAGGTPFGQLPRRPGAHARALTAHLMTE